MRLSKPHIIGIVFGAAIIIIDSIFFWGDKFFFFLLGIGIVIVSLPFIFSLVIETNVQKEKNERFLEFARNLAESVKAGTPIGQSIINMRKKNFGSLTPHVQKLANQITVGIPTNTAFLNFSYDINTPTISRAISLIREAEGAGGKIEDILDSVAKSMYQIDKLKKERRAAIYNLVVQGYIIFFIFICIMLVMQYKILPLTSDVGGAGNIGKFEGGASGIGAPAIFGGSSSTPEQLARPFLYLLLVQGAFTGMVVGKLAEGSIKAGIKHSFILSITAFLISGGARAFL